ncbi:hypothetical protein EOD41_04050 [Mucilaginibacter limnophilus]|uniref:Uncharacterized protein n=1 Tax=Mucilaginibacter limnophilus TaxID=1932778 RepID=A0A437MZM2_9SPHI|nr:hypothetical protein [Mucilaginibacter limnophilus]RVU03115.1 hypothetical protein EOD41_04050 [Mucilaginibacter limnophilus]
MNTENQNENTDPREDQIGENDGGNLAKGDQPTEQTQPDDERVETVTPDNDSGDPGPPVEERDSSNKDGGPKEENL